MLTRTFASTLAVLLATGTAVACAEERVAETEIAVAAEVLDAMGELVEVSRARPILRLTQRLAPGGPVGGAETTQEFTSLGRNLYGSRLSSSLGAQNVHGTGLTLCGLVELLGATQAPIKEQTQMTVVPIGSLFVPLGIRMRTDISSTSSVTRLTMSSPAAQLCEPAPGMTFSYEFDTVSKFRTKTGLVKMNSGLAVTQRSACTVSESQPVPGAIEGATGEYLPVSCEVTVIVGKSRKTNAFRRELAYLPEAGFYVTLSGHDHTAVQMQE
jgi:hypothetical protein